MSLPEKLIKSAKTGNLREVRKLLGRGVPITKDKFGNTALHEAAWNGHSDIVKVLLNAFCFVDSINNSGFTPLHLASQSGHAKTVKTLLKWRADPSLLNQHGETALHLAAKYNHPTVITVFVSFKINVDITGKDSNTALHIAAKLGNTEALKALLRGGASPHLVNMSGARPVDYAESGGFKPAIKLLNSKLKRKMRTDSSSNTPTPADRESREGSSPSITHSPRLHRANSASARIGLRMTHKKQNSVPSGLTSTVKAAQDASPTNTYEEIRGGLEIPPRPPTIDQLLSEIEQECHGPNYKYSPPGGRGPCEEAWVSPYGLPVPSTRPIQLQLSQDMPQHRKTASFDGFDAHRHDSFTPASDFLPLDEMRAVQNAVDRTFQVYETIPFRPSSDDDTYVYMAPCHDVQSDSPQPSPSSQEKGTPTADLRSKVPKRAIICSSPVVPGQRHEPKVALTPAKSILSQPSSLQQSEIDRYLQEELETMRKAFQIRLAQLEKRYQRQLRIQQQQRNSTGGAVLSIPTDVQLRAQRKGISLHRRSSWHSCLSDSDTEDLEPDQIQRSGSSQGFDSDCNVESDNDYVDASEVQFMSHDPYRGKSNATAEGVGNLRLQRTQSLGVKPMGAKVEGLKGGTRMWNVEPGNGARAGPLLSPVQDPMLDEAVPLSPDAKALVNERVSEHRHKILQYFQQVSEAKIASIEHQYELQMTEVENRYRSQASHKLSQLETRVKDLEKMLDIETLV